MVAASAMAVAVMVAVVVVMAAPLFQSFLSLRDAVLTVTGQAHRLQGFGRRSRFLLCSFMQPCIGHQSESGIVGVGGVGGGLLHKGLNHDGDAVNLHEEVRLQCISMRRSDWWSCRD